MSDDQIQPKLPLHFGIEHICINDQCFYVDAILSFDDIVWKEVWNSEIKDLDCVPC